VGTARKITLFALLALIVVGMGFYIFYPREPIYKGRPLSAWLERGDSAEAREAMESAGTNAIPILLHMLRAGDFPVKLKLIALVHRLPFVKSVYITAPERNQRAASAFGMLGANAGDAVPPLIRIYDEGASTNSICLTAFALGSIGPPAKAAIHSLLRGVASRDADIRKSAIRALGQIRSDPETVVPVLSTDGLKDSVELIRVDSVFALENFGTNARSAIPALTDSLHDASAAVRSLSAHALNKIGGLPQSDSETGSKGSTNTLPSTVLDRR
jgi:hypothetical protein